MRFATGKEFLDRPNKAISLIGMSGVGKTTLSAKLPRTRWFHYSGDYRIATRYMDEAILDNIKVEAMKNPFLANLLRRDAITISSNVSLSDLSPLSTYLGKLGDPAKGGLDLDEFRRRQRRHREAEIQAMEDIPQFMARAKRVYDYPHFINDAGGSAVETINFDDPSDSTLKALTDNTLLLYIKASEDDIEMLCARAEADPKPMYYCDAFLDAQLPNFFAEHGIDSVAQMDPDAYLRWAFPRLIEHRRDLYDRLGHTYGYTVDASRLFDVKDEAGFLALIAELIDAH